MKGHSWGRCKCGKNHGPHPRGMLGKTPWNNGIPKDKTAIKILHNPQRQKQKWFNLPRTSRQILLGSLIGDGSISKEGVLPIFYESHTTKQKHYLMWKHNALKKFIFLSKINKQEKYNRFYFRTLSNAVLLYPYNNMDEILNQLDLLGIAVWYCDDGSYTYNGRYIKFATHGFSFEKNQKLMNGLKKFGIDAVIKKDKHKGYGTYFFLFLNAKNTDNFLRLIKPIFEQYKIPECMWYKLGHIGGVNEGRIKNEKERRNRYLNKTRDRINFLQRKKVTEHRKRGLCRHCNNPTFKNYSRCYRHYMGHKITSHGVRE